MQKIAQFIMSKKFIPVILTITAICLFINFQSQGKNDHNDNPKEKHSKVLKNVRILLEDGHFSPQKIDDVFSKKVLKKFLEELDNEKNIFLKSDINGFKKYENSIDDEMNGKPLTSFYDINQVYQKRVEEVTLLYPSILEKPMEFNTDEKVQLESEKIDYPKNEKERFETWRKRLKYLVLSKFSDMQDDREKNKDKKDFVFKADSTLEREAREQVKKQMQRYFTTKKTRESVKDDPKTINLAEKRQKRPNGKKRITFSIKCNYLFLKYFFA